MNLPTFAALSAILCQSAQAVVLYGAGNSSNITDPGNGLPFDSVGRVASAVGAGDGGSGAYLGGGYMLTAAHIADNQLNSVTFDNSTYYGRDMTFTPVRIGQTDLKVFKLDSIPPVGEVSLYAGTSELLNNASLVGFGKGRADGTPLNSDVVAFAPDGSPLIKRWGTNQPKAAIDSFSYDRSSETYTFDALETILGNTQGNPADDGNGPFEAAAAPQDSGSGLFQQIDGTWYLTGITVVIASQNPGSATFGDDVPAVLGTGSPTPISLRPGAGDPNFLVRISSYQSQISAAIPEPSSLLLSLASVSLFFRRRR